MKAPLVAVLSLSVFTFTVAAQIPPAREIMKKSIPKDQQQPPPAPPASAAKPKAPTAKVAAPVVREKTPQEKAEIEKKTIEFQTQRAKQGAAASQYDLGIRYLTGAGVEKNEETARKWLDSAAKQNHTAAIKKLQELDKK